MLAGTKAGERQMERWRKFNKVEGAAYHALADAMRRLEWDLHNLVWRGGGLPPEWAEIAEDAGPGPKTRVTLWVDARAARFFRTTGKGWQTRMNDVLTAFVNARVAGALKGPEHFDLKRIGRGERRAPDPPRTGSHRTRGGRGPGAGGRAAGRGGADRTGGGVMRICRQKANLRTNEEISPSAGKKYLSLKARRPEGRLVWFHLYPAARPPSLGVAAPANFSVYVGRLRQ
jgi:hypothetical protein